METMAVVLLWCIFGTLVDMNYRVGKLLKKDKS